MGVTEPPPVSRPGPPRRRSALTAPELAAFQDEPPQMASGTVGKTGFLRLGFERRGDRTILADLERRTPYMAQRALYSDQAMPDLAWLFMITTSGCVLQGDRLALDVDARTARARARHHAVGDQDPHDGRQLRGADADPSRSPTTPTSSSCPSR